MPKGTRDPKPGSAPDQLAFDSLLPPNKLPTDFAAYNLLVDLRKGRHSLTDALRFFEDNQVYITHIETRMSPHGDRSLELFITIVCRPNTLTAVTNTSTQCHAITGVRQIKDTNNNINEDRTVPWFPQHISELDECAKLVKDFDPEVYPSHPGYNDEGYKKRRKDIMHKAVNYRHGQKIPKVYYTPDENATWTNAYRKIKSMLPTHACREYIEAFQELEQEGVFTEDRIPQFENVSNFLKRKTGCQLRPVGGYVSARDFLYPLAFRTFQATQLVRHSSSPEFSPDPDVIHDILGHIPMFANPKFAKFVQELGLASLGASDEDIERLNATFWFTVETGLCRQDGEVRAYGAVLMGSSGELENIRSDNTTFKEFDADLASVRGFQENYLQPTYFVADSLEMMMTKVRSFMSSLKRPFDVQYDPYTQSIECSDDNFVLQKPDES